MSLYTWEPRTQRSLLYASIFSTRPWKYFNTKIYHMEVSKHENFLNYSSLHCINVQYRIPPCVLHIAVVFTSSCSFACTGQHTALCVSMSQARGSLRTAPICTLHHTTSHMKALRSTLRCADCYTCCTLVLLMVTLLIVLLLLAQEAHLSEVNNWDKIEDFNWLSSSAPSPHWNVLPENQRTHVIDATNGL